MRGYEIAFALSAILMAILGCLTEVMRRQVHRARYGEQDLSPWSVRYVNDAFGRHGILGLHRRVYERSGVRALFWAVFIAFFASVALGIVTYVSR